MLGRLPGGSPALDQQSLPTASWHRHGGFPFPGFQLISLGLFPLRAYVLSALIPLLWIPSCWTLFLAAGFLLRVLHDAESTCSPHLSSLPSLYYCSVAKSCLTLNPMSQCEIIRPQKKKKRKEIIRPLNLHRDWSYFLLTGSSGIMEGRLFISYQFSENEHPGPWEAEKSSLFIQSWDSPVAPNPTPCLAAFSECPRIYTVFSASWK